MISPDSRQLPPDVRNLLRDEIPAGEEIIWMDQPVASRLLTPGLLLGSFGVFMAGAGIEIYLYQSLGNSFAAYPDWAYIDRLIQALEIVMILSGIGIVAIPLLIVRGLRRTFYVITRKRAIIFQHGIRGRRVHTFTPAALSNILRKERADGSGDLIFARQLMQDSDGHSYYAPTGFLYLRDVKQPDALIRQLAETV